MIQTRSTDFLFRLLCVLFLLLPIILILADFVLLLLPFLSPLLLLPYSFLSPFYINFVLSFFFFPLLSLLFLLHAVHSSERNEHGFSNEE